MWRRCVVSMRKLCPWGALPKLSQAPALRCPGLCCTEGVAAADVPDALTDLSNKGLESHHMVVVMAVLVCCPHLKRLRLDGNKVGRGGD